MPQRRPTPSRPDPPRARRCSRSHGVGRDKSSREAAVRRPVSLRGEPRHPPCTGGVCAHCGRAHTAGRGPQSLRMFSVRPTEPYY